MSNADQGAFWNAQSSWRVFQEDMDTCIAPVLDLVLDHADVQPGTSVLDIGCGTGASVLAFSDRVGPGGHVLGLDIAPSLLAMARDRCGHLDNVTLMEADAQTAHMPMVCDAAVSRFGVMFFDDTPKAFANIAGSLRKSATITCAAWAHAADNPFFIDAAKAARAVLGPMPKTDRSQPGPFAFEDADRVRADFEAAGLVTISIKTVPIHLTPNDDLDRFAALCMAIGPAASALRHFEADAQKQGAVAQSLIETFRVYRGDAGLRVPASIHVIEAQTA